MTETVAIPGLESAETPAGDVSPAMGHWIERGPLKRLMVFSGRSHNDLAEAIARQLGVELGEIQLEQFANGETYCRYLESIRGVVTANLDATSELRATVVPGPGTTFVFPGGKPP